MSLDGQTAQGQGNELAFTVKSWVEALTVACTATDDETGVTAKATKQLQVLGNDSRFFILFLKMLYSNGDLLQSSKLRHTSGAGAHLHHQDQPSLTLMLLKSVTWAVTSGITHQRNQLL